MTDNPTPPVAEGTEPTKCKYCNRVGCESAQFRHDPRLLRICRLAVQLERDFLANRVGRLESALERAEGTKATQLPIQCNSCGGSGQSPAMGPCLSCGGSGTAAVVNMFAAEGAQLDFHNLAVSWAPRIAAIDTRSVLVAEYLERELRHVMAKSSPGDDNAEGAKAAECGRVLCKRCLHPAAEHTDGCPTTESYWMGKLREEQGEAEDAKSTEGSLDNADLQERLIGTQRNVMRLQAQLRVRDEEREALLAGIKSAAQKLESVRISNEGAHPRPSLENWSRIFMANTELWGLWNGALRKANPSPAREEKDSSPSPGAPGAGSDSGAEKPREVETIFRAAPDSPGDEAGATKECTCTASFTKVPSVHARSCPRNPAHDEAIVDDLVAKRAARVLGSMDEAQSAEGGHCRACRSTNRLVRYMSCGAVELARAWVSAVAKSEGDH